MTGLSRAQVSQPITLGVMVAAMRGRPPNEPIRQFPNRLREWRLARQKSQRELAIATGQKPQSVARHETGENQMTQTQMEAYARVLNIKPEELFNDALRITNRARVLLEIFEQMPPDQQETLLRIGRTLRTPVPADDID